jgi:hypothetical protein
MLQTTETVLSITMILMAQLLSLELRRYLHTVSDGTKHLSLLSRSPLSSVTHSNFLSFLLQTIRLVGLNCCFTCNTICVITKLHMITHGAKSLYGRTRMQGCDTVLLEELFRTFQRAVVPSSSVSG